MPKGFTRDPALRDQARHLRTTTGLTYREIGEQLVVPLKTVASWVLDPDAACQRARRKRYAGKCEVCGAATDGSQGPGKAPKLCNNHTRAKSHADAEARLIDMIQAWADEHGGIPPGATDWNAAQAEKLGHHDRARKAREEGWPGSSAVQHVFGSWNKGIEAAGFDPTRPSTWGRGGEDIGLCVEIRERYEEGESMSELALDYWCSTTAIKYRIEKAGGTPRTPREAQQMRHAA